MHRTINQAPPMSREDSYGFRCAQYYVKGNEWAFQPRVPATVELNPPATADEIKQYLRFFEYDKDVPLKDVLVRGSQTTAGV